jgi:threonylcarbamoyladenosine tRNA methylthiotransferase MtaB
MPAAKTFYVKNFGCRATQADGAAVAADLAARGLRVESASSAADVVIVNTCTVTHQADQDARQTVRRLHRENPGAEILVTGCYAQRRPAELSALPGVKWVVGNSHKAVIGDIVAPRLIQIDGLTHPGGLAYHGEIREGGTLVGDIFERQTFLSAAVVEAGQDRTRPNLKIQDGCNNRCRFCVIPSVRGSSRSAPAERVIEQIRGLAARYSEVVLTGINLGRWGRDLPGRPRFAALLRRVLAETEVGKLRISSVEPMDWTSDLLDLFSSDDRICKHIHIPLQSGSDAVLKAMRRRYRARHYADRVGRARALMPAAAIGADVMVGFPGETDEDFEATRQLVADLPFTYLHVFSYSQRPGTEAAEMPGQVPAPVKKLRNRILREQIAEKNLTYRQSLVGSRFSAVILDQHGHGETQALTDNYIRVALDAPTPSPGKLADVVITSCNADSTRARILN